ncbi:tyrosine-type recombinase/integrase [Methylobacterium sp. C33D]
MRQFPHLKRNHRSGNWVYFRRFPLALQPALGKIFFERSLRTADRTRIPGAWAVAHQEFEAAVELATRGMAGSDPQRQPDPEAAKWFNRAPRLPKWDGDVQATFAPLDLRVEEIKSAITVWGKRQRYERAQRILNDPTYREAEDDFAYECRLVGACGLQREPWALFCPPLLALTHEVLAEAAIPVPPLHASMYSIQRMVEDELRAVLEAEGQWRLYNFADMPSSPPLDHRSAPLAPNGQPYIMIHALIDQYVAITRKSVKTVSKLRMVARHIESLHDGPVPLNQLSKSLLIKLQTDALKLPARPSHSEKRMSFVQQVEMASQDKSGRNRLTPQAIRSWFNLLSAALSWAVKADLLDKNPTLGIKPVVRPAEERSRNPFSSKDLELIFDPARYPSNDEPSRYWIPIIALLTGARLNEIGQLHCADVSFDDGIWINITDLSKFDGAQKRLKNLNSRRIVPGHPLLERLGFPAYLRSQKSIFLFPDLPHGGHYEPTKAFSQWFGRYLSRAGIDDPTKVFHSFRHTFKDECRRAGIEEEVHDALTGHAGGTRVGRSYGAGVPADALRAAINRLEFRDLTLILYRHIRVC